MITEHVVAIDFIESEEVQDNRRAAYSELEDLVERGVELPCELLFSKFPNMAANRDWVLELIYLEYVLRRERGQSPTLADFQRRFPNLQRDIEMLIEVDSVIGVTEPIDSNSTQGKLDESIHLRSASIAKSVSRQLGRVGDYELQEVIGRGGMGIVYRGTQPRLGRAVAVKTIDAMASLDASVVRRFLAEATLAARLQHPNIVPIYEVGSHADIPFFSMELVTGGTLAQATSERPLQPKVAARLVETLARAVDYAHSQGVVHRDLKPANILLSPSVHADAIDLCPPDSMGSHLETRPSEKFEPKIADFGLAKFLGSEVHRSITGALIGTPSYMSPEQVDSTLGEAGPACDIYALGTILYDVLVGRPPFHAATVIETMRQVRDEEPISPRKWQSKIPYDLETICLTCLRKEPDQRYASAELLADDLRRFLSDEPILARSTGPLERAFKWTRRHPSLATLMASVLFASISVTWLWLRAEQSRELEHVARQRGERLLYVRNFSLAQFEYQSHNVERCREILQSSRPEFRNWEWHYLNNKCHQAIWESPRDPQAVVATSLSPDGRSVAIGRGQWGKNRPQKIEVWDIESNQQIWSLDGHPASQICDVNFSPDGQLLLTAAITWKDNKVEGAVIVWNMRDGSKLFRLANADAYVARFSPDGTSIIVGETSGVVRQYATNSGAPIRKFGGSKSMVLDVDFHPNGRYMASSWRDGTLAIWDLTSGKRIDYLTSLGDPRKLAWSRDGRTILVGGYSGELRTYHFKSDHVELASIQSRAALPYIEYSPDGMQLAVAVFGEGAELRGTASARVDRVFYGHGGHVRSLAFDALGKRLATGGSDGIVQVWDVMQPEPQATESQTSGAAVVAMASCPSRSEIALATTRNITLGDSASGVPRIELKDPRSTKVSKILTGHTDWLTCIGYSRDGERLITGSMDNSVRIWEVATGTQISIFNEHAQRIVSAAFVGDGENAISADADGSVNVWQIGTGKVLRAWQIGATTTSLTIHPSQPIAVVGTASSAFTVWNIVTGKRIQNHSNDGAIGGMAFSPDGKQLALFGERPIISIWKTAELLSSSKTSSAMTLSGHSSEVTGVSFSPDSLRLVSCSRDQSVRLFDLVSGYELMSLGEAKGTENAILFCADGKHIVRSRNHQLFTWTLDQTSDNPIDWHKGLLRKARAAQNHHAAEFHLGALIELEPENIQHFYSRALARSRYGNWEGTEQDLHAALEHKKELSYHSLLARTSLKLGKLTEYQRMCRLMYDEVKLSNNPLHRNAFGWIACVGADCGVEPELIVAELEKSLANKPKPTYYNDLALACYRAHRYRDAILHAHKSLALDTQASAPCDWIILAMSHAQMKSGASDQSKTRSSNSENDSQSVESAQSDPNRYLELASKWLADQYRKRRAGQKTSPSLNQLLQLEIPQFNEELRVLFPVGNAELKIEFESGNDL